MGKIMPREQKVGAQWYELDLFDGFVYDHAISTANSFYHKSS